MYGVVVFDLLCEDGASSIGEVELARFLLFHKRRRAHKLQPQSSQVHTDTHIPPLESVRIIIEVLSHRPISSDHLYQPTPQSQPLPPPFVYAPQSPASSPALLTRFDSDQASAVFDASTQLEASGAGAGLVGDEGPDLYLLTEVIAEILAEFDADIDGQVTADTYTHMRRGGRAQTQGEARIVSSGLTRGYIFMSICM